MLSLYIILIALIIITLLLITTNNTHIINIIRFGLPKTKNYNYFPYKKIETYTPRPIPYAPQLINNIDNDLLAKFNYYHTQAFLILKNGELITEKYYGISPEEKINSFSAAKSILSLLIGIALDKKIINSLDQNVISFFPEFNISPRLTIKHLLTMSSGLKWSENFVNPFSDVAKAFYTNDLWKIIKKTRSIYTPGQQFSYKCLNSILLGLILEKASGMTVTKFAEKYLWNTIGAENHALWTADKKNITKTFCCFYSTARDFAKIGLLILNTGFYNNTQIVSSNYINQMLTPASFLIDKYGNTVNYYGFHIWFTKFNNNTIPYIRGMYGQYIFIIPQYNAVVVRLGQKRSLKLINHTPEDVFIYLKAAKHILDTATRT